MIVEASMLFESMRVFEIKSLAVNADMNKVRLKQARYKACSK